MQLEDRVISLIQSNIEKKHTVTLQSDLRHDLEVDSFGTIMIVNAIEDAFGIEVEDADIRTLTRVVDIVELLEKKYCQPAKQS
jgi:acyl carrier protein